MWSALRIFQEENHEETIDTEVGPIGCCELSFVYGGSCVRTAVALAMVLVGAMGMRIIPAEYFGVVERFSVFAATGFHAALGIHLFCMKPKEIEE